MDELGLAHVLKMLAYEDTLAVMRAVKHLGRASGRDILIMVCRERPVTTYQVNKALYKLAGLGLLRRIDTVPSGKRAEWQYNRQGVDTLLGMLREVF